MTVQWLFGWWNLLFIVPFLLALLCLAVFTVGGLSFGEGDADVSPDADADADLHADVDADVDADGEVAPAGATGHLDTDVSADAHGAGADAAHPHDSDGSARPAAGWSMLSLLAWLGVGRVPVSIVVLVLLLTWGVAGFIANVLTGPGGDWRAIYVSLPVALVASLAMTRIVARAMGRWVPLNETYATRRHDLLGTAGEAIFTIDQSFGMAAVRDAHGDLFQVACRLSDPAAPPVAKGAKVVLVAYHKEGWYAVATQAATAAAPIRAS